MNDSQQMHQDIMRTIRGALEMSKLVKESRYDERVLSMSSHSITELSAEEMFTNIFHFN
ncbi:MAG: hypothetical protein WCF23_00315 [Candidatus Nitrosopolaris sp.]